MSKSDVPPSEFYIPAYNFTGSLKNLESGHVVIISGLSCVDAESSFEIALKSCTAEKFTAPLQLSVRFGKINEIVRSTVIDDEWKHEERKQNLFPTNSNNPLMLGAQFKISISIDHEKFLIVLNDKPFCTYALRLPLTFIDTISISKNFERIYEVTHITGSQFDTHLPLDVMNFKAFVPSKFKAGKAVCITATPRGTEGYFVINFSEAGNDESLLSLKFKVNNEEKEGEDDDEG